MAVFRELDNKGRDRSAEDRRRHRQLVEDAIKKNIGSIIAEESIIGQSKDKKIKIPVRGVKEYQFIYGKNAKYVGSGDGTEKRGDRIDSDRLKKQNQDQAGNEEGEDYYETEVTIEELIGYLLDDLNLPFLDRKKLASLEAEKDIKRSGYRKKGTHPRLAKKKSMMERIKRKKSSMRARRERHTPWEREDMERFPFREEDLRYYQVREDIKKETNAAVICIMDTSGSMSLTKKYLARSFYFLLYQFVRHKYVNVEIVYVAHTTVAKEVTEEEFFHKGESGGTYISSGYQKALEIIEERYNPAIWNIYAFHCSDGDNWQEDNEKAVQLALKLCGICNLFGYGQIMTFGDYHNSIKTALFSNVKKANFSIVTIIKKDDIVPALIRILNKDRKE